MSYYFFLGGTMLPVPPPKMETKINGQNKTINLINEGEVNLLKTTGLTDISFTCLLPNSQYPFASYDASLQGGLVGYALGEVSRRVGGIFGNAFLFRGGRTFLDAIKIAKESMIPMRFIVSRMGFNHLPLWHTNMLCSIENYTILESASNGTDLAVQIDLKEYRWFGTKEVEVSKDANGKETLTVKEPRYSPAAQIPAAMRLTTELSVLEACKGISQGALDWRSVAVASGITNPLEKNLKGKVLKFV